MIIVIINIIIIFLMQKTIPSMLTVSTHCNKVYF